MTRQAAEVADVTYICMAFNLSYLQAKMVKLMLGMVVVSPDVFSDRLNIRETRIAIHRLKQKLHRYDIPIGCQYGVGYFIPPEKRMFMQNMISRVKQSAAYPQTV